MLLFHVCLGKMRISRFANLADALFCCSCQLLCDSKVAVASCAVASDVRFAFGLLLCCTVAANHGMRALSPCLSFVATDDRMCPFSTPF